MTPEEFYALVGTPYGFQKDYPRDGQWGTHNGTDFPWRGGTPIPSWTAGAVVDKGFNNALGHYIVIDRGEGVDYRYAGFAHMREASPLPIGTGVEIGTWLGKVGTSGDSTGNHLHATAGQNIYPGSGRRTNPLPLILASLAAGSSGTAGGGTTTLPSRKRIIVMLFQINDKDGLNLTVVFNGKARILTAGIDDHEIAQVKNLYGNPIACETRTQYNTINKFYDAKKAS